MYTSLFSTCNGYWDLRDSLAPIIGAVSGTVDGATDNSDRFELATRAYSFDGSNDKITMGNTAVNIKSLLFWVKLTSTTQSILKLTDTPHKITISSGTIAATGWPATVIIYVDGEVSSTISDTNWHLVCITTSGTAFAASNLVVGYDGTSYLTGSINEVLTFSTQLSAVTVKTLYNLMSKKALYGTMSGIRAVE